MTRGDIVSIAAPGGDEPGKPRPALIVQSDIFLPDAPGVTICLISSQITGLNLFRIRLDADPATGLRQPGEIRVDTIQSVHADRVGPRIGRVPEEIMFNLDQALRRWLAL